MNAGRDVRRARHHVATGWLPPLPTRKPEVVFHHAAQIDVRESVRDPLHDADVNVVGTVNVLRAAVDAGARRVVFASSGGAIYGDTDVIPTPGGPPAASPSLRTAPRSSAPRRTAGRSAARPGSSSSRCATPTCTDRARIRTARPGVVAIFATRLIARRPAGHQRRRHPDARLRARRTTWCAPTSPPSTARAGVYNIGTGVETDVNTLYRMLAAAVRRQRRRRARSRQSRRAATLVPRPRRSRASSSAGRASIALRRRRRDAPSTSSGTRARAVERDRAARGSPQPRCAARPPRRAARHRARRPGASRESRRPAQLVDGMLERGPSLVERSHRRASRRCARVPARIRRAAV